MRERTWTPERRAAWLSAAEAWLLDGATSGRVDAFKRWATDAVPSAERRAWNMRSEDASRMTETNRATPPNWRVRDLPEAAVEALAFVVDDVAFMAQIDPSDVAFLPLTEAVAPFVGAEPPKRSHASSEPETSSESSPPPIVEPAQAETVTASVAAPVPVPAPAPAPLPVDAGGLGAAGPVLLEALGLRAAIEARIGSALGSVTEAVRVAAEDGARKLRESEAALLARVDEKLRDVQVTVHEIRVDGRAWRPSGSAPLHPAVPTIVARLKAGLNVLAYGPRGSGKTFMASQVAEALGVPLWTTSCSGAASDALFRGRLVPCVVDGHPAARYEPSAFVRGYECSCGAAEARERGEDASCEAPCGGLVLLDEIDRIADDVAVAGNAALSNGHLSVPARGDRPVALRSGRCFVLATSNTKLRGATAGYGAAVSQDAAFADRFRGGALFVGYAEELESRLGPDALVRAVWKLREKVRETSVRETVGMRFITDGVKLMATGLSVDEAVSACAWDWSPESRERAGLPAVSERW